MKYIRYFLFILLLFIGTFINNDPTMGNILKFFLVALTAWLALVIILDWKKIPHEKYGVLLIFRTERSKGFLQKVGKFRTFWKVYSSLGVLIGYLGMLAFFFLIISNFYFIYMNPLGSLPEGTRGAMPIIPGVTVPLHWIIALIIVLIVHEFAHGIIAISERIPIKKLGVFLATIIPLGAFVEPDEEALKSSSTISKLRVYAAGSFTNLMVAALIGIPLFLLPILGIGFFLNPFIGPIQIMEVVNETPADGVLEKGMLIKSINGVEFSETGDFRDLLIFSNITSRIMKGDQVVIETDRGGFVLEANSSADSQRGLMGIMVSNSYMGLIDMPLHITRVAENSSASGVLERGMYIKSINDKPFSRSGNDKDLALFRNITSQIKAGDQVEIITDKGEFLLEAGPVGNPDRGFIGIQISPAGSENKQFIREVLETIATLNFIIGIMNLGPILIVVAATDGHHMFNVLLFRIFSFINSFTKRVSDREKFQLFISEKLDENAALRITTIVSLSMMILIIYMLLVPAPSVIGG